MAVSIWLPETARAGRLHCRVCGEDYVDEQHVIACADRHHDRLMLASPRVRAGWFAQEVDPEWGEHCRRVLAQDPNPDPRRF